MAAFGDGNAIRTGLEYFSTHTSFAPAVMIQKNWLDAFKDSRVTPGAGSETMTELCKQLFGLANFTGGTSPAALSTFEGVQTESLLAAYTFYPVSCLQNIDRPTLSTLVGLDLETIADNTGRSDAQGIAEKSALLNKLPDTVQFGFHDNLYKPRDYNSGIVTIHGPGAIMDPFGRTAPYAQYSPATTKDGSTVWWSHGNLDAYDGLELRLWRNLGFQTLNKVNVVITNADTVTVNVVTTSSDVTYTMNIRGDGVTVDGALPDPNPFDGNTVKNTWLRENGLTDMPTAQNLVLYKEALGDTKQVIDAKLFLGSNVGSGSVFTSDEVVALMCLFSGIPVVTAILKNKQDPTKELHQGMLHLPLSGSAIPDPMALKQGFIDMCKAYNDKQLAVIDACVLNTSGTPVTIKGAEYYDIPQNYKTMMGKVPEFATSIIAKLVEVAATFSVPEFKKLCVSSYLVNLVTKTSTKFKINQYASLLKSNRAFADILSGLKSSDPLATMGAAGASSRKRSRKTRRSRRRTISGAQRGGSNEFEATRAGFLQGTANFYNSLDRFAWDDDTRWDFLNFCYPYLEYVGDCGSTHPDLLNYLKRGYDELNAVVSNASSSSAASAGGGEHFLDDLIDFEDWYIKKLNELRRIQLDLVDSPTFAMAHSADNVIVDESNVFGEVPEEVNAIGLTEGEEVNSVNASAIQPATAPQSRPTTPIPSSNPQSGPPSYLGTPAPGWRLGAGGGGGGTLTNFSPGRYSESYSEANMSQNKQSSSSAASLVGNTPMSQGRRSPTSSVTSAAPEGSRQMQRLPVGGGGGPPSSSAATGEPTYFGAGQEAQAAEYTIKPAQTEAGYEFRLQDPPIQASVAAGGGGALTGGKSRPFVATNESVSPQPAKSSKKQNNANAGFSSSTSSSAAASSSAPAKSNSSKFRRKTRRARRSTTRRNRR